MRLLLIHGHFITMDPKNPTAEGILIEGHRIKKIGQAQELLKLKDKHTRVIDLKGKTVIPGFNDSHLHLLNYAYGLGKIDCSQADSIDEILFLIQQRIKEKPIEKGSWVLARGWNSVLLGDQRELTRWDLDRISTDHPIVLTRICEHVVVINSKALELCGVHAGTPQPLGGVFDTDEKGEPTGVFREAARYMVYDRIPDASKEQIKEMLYEAARRASRFGLTSVQSDDFETFSGKDYGLIIEAYRELAAEKKLPLRVYLQCLLPDMNRLKAFLQAGYRTGDGDDYVKIGPLKLLTDGSLGARTAYLREPYSDDPSNRGIHVFSQSALDQLVLSAHRQGMQVLTHAIGDGAIEMCLESFKRAQKEHKREDPRFGILHLQITDEDIFEAFKTQNIIAFAEPICMNNDLHMAQDRIGEKRLKTSYHYRAFLDRGIPYALSSDCPVDSLNPLDSLYVAVTRKDYSGYPPEGWFPEKALSVYEALYGFTLGSAYASFEEKIKGSLEEGKLADLVILSEDILTIAPDSLRDVEVLMTLFDGAIVYTKEESD